MKIPVWLLRLLPMWDYICPKCRKEVEKNSSKCPFCGEQYGSPVRVPPKVLKDKKALEDYVHKHIFPRVSKAQRDYLAQYFTVLFSDGFESGNFDNWTSTATSEVDDTITVVSTDPHHGIYHARAYTDGDGGTEYAWARKTLDEEQTVYQRAYYKIVTNGAAESGNKFNIMRMVGNSNSVAFAYCINSSGTLVWQIQGRNGAGWATDTSAIEVSTGIWYCVELYWYYHATSGALTLWIDGAEVCSLSGLDTTEYGAIDDIRFGLPAAVNCGVCEVYVDCVVVADTYIGPETMEQTYTKTWTTDALFKKLGIPKTLGVDATFQKQDIPKTFGLDATFQKSFLIQKQIDAFFKRFGILKNFAVDARFGSLMTHTISKQIDVLLKRLDATKTFGLDVYFGPVEAETYAKNFGLDIIFAYKVRLPELWLDENGKIVLNISKPYTWVGT